MARRQPLLFTAFSADARAELKEALGPSALQVVPVLQELAKEHLSPREVARRTSQVPKTGHAGRAGAVARRRMAAALRLTIKRIDEHMLFVQSSGRVTMRSLVETLGGVTEADRLKAIRKGIEAHLSTHYGQEQFLLRRRGRPVDRHRNGLALDVAIVLRLKGVPVSTSRNGTFARVLEVLLTEMYGAAPGDMFRLIREVAKWVNADSENELRALVMKAARYYSNPSFWLRLAAV